MHEEILQKSREIQQYVQQMRHHDQQRDMFIHEELHKLSESKLSNQEVLNAQVSKV